MKEFLKLSGLILVMAITSCATQDPISYERESEYYYGEGQGATVEEAEVAAKIDLISSILKVLITAEMADSFEFEKLKPYIEEEQSGTFYIVYRYSVEDWNEIYEPRKESLRAELTKEFRAAKGMKDPVASLMATSSILERLSMEGLYLVLTLSETDDTLLSETFSNYLKELVSKMLITVSGDGAFLKDNSVVEVKLTSSTGKALGKMPLSLTWSSGDYQGESISSVTNEKGIFNVKFPKSDELRNREVKLTVSFKLSKSGANMSYLKDLEKSSVETFKFHHFGDFESSYSNEVVVPGGEYVVGALKHDKRAEAKEVSRKVEINDFSIEIYQVTNKMFKAYLDDMKIPSSDWPDYLDNDSYNQDDQPVIGVSIEDVNGYIAWLESRFGLVKRLPTEDEWEIAAHGGSETIYPWGDETPDEGSYANFIGSDGFDETSPVGVYPDGVNGLGLFDMAGNVWEWTSTKENNEDETGRVTVKGGSWMDGPNELRVSTRRYLDPTERYSDVGFRLVREVSSEVSDEE